VVEICITGCARVVTVASDGGRLTSNESGGGDGGGDGVHYSSCE